MTDHQNIVVPLVNYDMAEILGDTPDAFGVAGLGFTWRSKEHHVGIRAEPDGRLVAHAGLVVLPLSAGGRHLDVVGLGGVAVAAERRGQGLARAVVDGALVRARALGPQVAILFCLPEVAGLYARLGWRPVEGPVEVEQPAGPVVMPLRSMWFPLHEGAQWPEGAVRLHSLPM
ncbi:GNAT family N-acetyltransferase [Kitasatospora sp. NPDC058032]|uniref:GNAT family N-acetyltransferase n=1 Tax=Kitasatospora sp. NPDC058032 TaxID=3346307 RepID=UPI0036D8935F